MPAAIVQAVSKVTVVWLNRFCVHTYLVVLQCPDPVQSVRAFCWL